LNITSDTEELVLELLGQPPVNEAENRHLSMFSPSNRRVLYDLFALESSEEIYAPPRSSFSLLAARLGGKTIKPLTRPRLTAAEAKQLAIRSSAFWSNSNVSLRNNILSRDIDQYVNCLTGIADLHTFGYITDRALAADPSNVTSLVHSALSLELSGQDRAARKNRRAAELRARESLTFHQDPLTIVLLGKYICQIFRYLRMLERGTGKALGRRFLVLNLRISLAEIATCKPYQIDHNFIQVAQDAYFLVLESLKERPLFSLGKKEPGAPLSNFLGASWPHSDSSIFVMNLLLSLRRHLTKI
jgi:hypothetical protein